MCGRNGDITNYAMYTVYNANASCIVILHMCCIIVTWWGGPGKIEA